jgi:hypothetical protein
VVGAVGDGDGDQGQTDGGADLVSCAVSS